MMEYISAQESAKFLFKHRQNKLSINDLPKKYYDIYEESLKYYNEMNQYSI